MGRNSEPAIYEGKPLPSFRNVPAEYFFAEDDTSFSPLSDYALDALKSIAPLYESSQLEVVSSSEDRELGNPTLPVFAHREAITQSVLKNPFTIIVAETGAGKSTQVPQFLLNEGWDTVYLTQPRRAASRNVFERIRSEVTEVCGEFEAGNLISYETAGERQGPDSARIKVVTDGLHLVRELHDKGVEHNEVLIIDEVHEWNSNIEVLVAWVKKVISEKPSLRVVVMSATMDASRLANYFADVCPTIPPVIEIPGRNYAVERSEKPESTVVEEVRKAAEEIVLNSQQNNGILVFEPGKREIQEAIDKIRQSLPPEIAKVAMILPLHAKLSPAEQQAAFRKYPGVKIVVATDVAQTSLTIPDIRYVIDSGYQRRMELDHEGVQGLVLHPASQADCDQRAGRAGRVSDGFYILTRLDNKTPHTPYIGREKYPLAEILRTDIVRNTLRISCVGLDISELDLYHPVRLDLVQQAQSVLQKLGALDANNVVTAVGKRMNEFPICASSARMMVESGRYSELTRSYLAAIISAKEVGGLQYFAYNVGKRWKDLTDEVSSDLLAQLDIYIAIQNMTTAEMKDFDLDIHNIERAREQYRKIAKKVGALQETFLPPTAQEREDLKKCIIAGHVNSMYTYGGSQTYTPIMSSGDGTVRQISNRSVVRGSPAVIVGDAYRVVRTVEGVTDVKHILEHVTGITLAELGRTALDVSMWVPDGFVLRADGVRQVRRQHVLGTDIGISEEIIPEPSRQLREYIIRHTLENPGPKQRELRAIKTTLETLAHRAKHPFKKLTHDDIVELIKEAAPIGTCHPSQIDLNLGSLITERAIGVGKYVSAQMMKEIYENSPDTLHIEEVELAITYRNRKPFVRHYKPSDIASLPDEILLNDGRHVHFIYDGKPRTLLQMKEIYGLVSYVTS